MNKGIILSGGKGTRLYPLTTTISKQILPVYNKPMIYYPLKTLKDMNIRDILVIVADEFQYRIFFNQLGNGNQFDLNISYEIQESPRGLPDAFIIGENFIKDSESTTLILGDNVFINCKIDNTTDNQIFTYKVKNPSSYGVVELHDDNTIKRIIEKPTEYISDDAVVGLYKFNSNLAIEQSKKLKPSSRGELEITDLITEINNISKIKVHQLNGFWFDCGNFDDLLDCSNLIRTIEHRTNKKIIL